MTPDTEQIVDEKAMQKMSVAPPDPDETETGDGDMAREEKELEEGLEETFPASDPPANVQPGHDRPMPSSGYDEKSEKD